MSSSEPPRAFLASSACLSLCHIHLRYVKLNNSGNQENKSALPFASFFSFSPFSLLHPPPPKMPSPSAASSHLVRRTANLEARHLYYAHVSKSFEQQTKQNSNR